mgnify:CR=1 FL=1
MRSLLVQQRSALQLEPPQLEPFLFKALQLEPFLLKALQLEPFLLMLEPLQLEILQH